MGVLDGAVQIHIYSLIIQIYFNGPRTLSYGLSFGKSRTHANSTTEGEILLDHITVAPTNASIALAYSYGLLVQLV